MISIAQFGFPKSGNYLFYVVLKEALSKASLFRSFREKLNLPADIQNYLTTLPDGFESNYVTIKEERLQLIIPHPIVRLMPIDNIPDFLEQSAIIRSHDSPTQLHFDILKRIDYWFYVYRDGRDAINSLMHYVITPPLLRRHPEYKITSIKEIYQNYEYFAKHVQLWKENIEKGFSFPERFFFVRFEKMVRDKERFLLELEAKIGIKFSIEEALKATSFETMQSVIPIHIRKGKIGDWKFYFDEKHKAIFKDITGNTLINLGYEKSLDW